MRGADRRSITTAALLAFLSFCGTGCATRTLQLSVDIQTNRRPDTFHHARVTVRGPDGPSERVVPTEEILLTPRRAARIATFDVDSPGAYTVIVDLQDAMSNNVLSVRRSIVVRRDYALFLYLDDACRAAECDDRACVGGACAPPACSSTSEPSSEDAGAEACACPSCTATECGVARCIDGLCAQLPNDALCEPDERCNAEGACEPASACSEWRWVDRDGDGLGGHQEERCAGPGIVPTGGDCDDERADVGRCRGCGDGTTDGSEPCDDGNAIDGDGCDVNCTITRCGNGVVTSGESCDDGNAIDGDECSSTCGADFVDGGIVDGGLPDAGPREESCSAGTAGAEDEDLDGTIDESCPYFHDSFRAHLFGRGRSFFAMEPIGETPQTFLLSLQMPSTSWVQALRRSALDAPIEHVGSVIFDPTDVAPYTPLANMLAVVRTGPTAGCDGVVQANDTVAGVYEMWRVHRDPPEGGTCASDVTGTFRYVDRVSADPAIDGLFHPFLTSDGLTLIARVHLALDDPRIPRIAMSTRASLDAEFPPLTVVSCPGTPECCGEGPDRICFTDACAGGFPAITDDRRHLTFESCAALTRITERSGDGSFGEPVDAPGTRVRAVYVPRTLEVFSRDGRSHYTRDVPGTDVAVDCPAPGELSTFGWSCVTELAGPVAFSETLCGPSPEHHLLTAYDVVDYVDRLAGRAWIGASDAVGDDPIGFVWVTDDAWNPPYVPDPDLNGAFVLDPDVVDPAQRLVEVARTTPHPALCEHEPWPVWPPLTP